MTPTILSVDLHKNPVAGERNISTIMEKVQTLILIVSPNIESGIEKCTPQRLLLESKERTVCPCRSESWMFLGMFLVDNIAVSVFVDFG